MLEAYEKETSEERLTLYMCFLAQKQQMLLVHYNYCYISFSLVREEICDWFIFVSK